MVQDELQRYILKVHSSKIRKANWDLNLPLSDARKNDEIISLASSQMLRWIDELNGDEDSEERAREIRNEIRQLRKLPNTRETKRQVRKLYSELDRIQFKPDYVSIIMDRKSDYKNLCKGFKINGIPYKRMLGTAGGIKMSTIVFVSVRLYDELNKRVNNGRDMSKAFNPAKLEAYKALTCSASHPVSMPNGIAVVKDCETEFFDTVIHLENGPGDEEPIMSDPVYEKIKIDASDGFGLMLPSLAERWSQELGLKKTVAGFNTRCSFEKGMVFTFDFLDFADKVAGSYIIKDVWGYDIDLRNVELILTESMLKLWDSYGSCDEYMRNCRENKYTFAVTKNTPIRLESERSLNYQFIQSFNLDDNDIQELVSNSMNQIEDVLGGDWRKTLLFMCGMDIDEYEAVSTDNYVAKAIMVYPEIMNDPYIQDCVYKQVRGRIKEAKTGVLNVHGNYSIASGDPYSLCQSMFGLEVTGLLKAGEIYNAYWRDSGSGEVVCFRAPMSCHENIRKLNVADSLSANYWYRYMDTCTIFNSWDNSMASLNGMDFDGDLVMLTDNPVLLRKYRRLPALICAQSSAQKIIPTDDDFVKSNISGFGNDIGKITNRITSMYELQSYFDKDSEEYKTLGYRICCGQLHQQDCIDRIKGVIAKPMAKAWYDFYALKDVPEPDAELYKNILAYRKPYFMRYIYAQLSKDYSKYEKTCNRNAKRRFGKDLKELLNCDRSSLSDDEFEFVERYYKDLPLGIGPCVMNKICYSFEDRFDSVKARRLNNSFDYQVLKSADATYSQYEYNQVKKLYLEYRTRIQNYVIHLQYEREDNFERAVKIKQINEEFMAECNSICPNEDALCNIVLDITYNTEAGKMFAWSMCGDIIIKNLMDRFGHKLSFPVANDDGDIQYSGHNFELMTIDLEE